VKQSSSDWTRPTVAVTDMQAHCRAVCGENVRVSRECTRRSSEYTLKTLYRDVKAVIGTVNGRSGHLLRDGLTTSTMGNHESDFRVLSIKRTIEESNPLSLWVF
jgi:hypothetical protein